MMSLTMSRSTGELVPLSGSRRWPAPGWPSGIFRSAGDREEPTVHSTNFSPISDCGRIVQCASPWNGENPADQPLARRLRRQDVRAKGELVEDRLDPRVVAVRVVVRGALAELREPAGQVG